MRIFTRSFLQLPQEMYVTERR